MASNLASRRNLLKWAGLAAALPVIQACAAPVPTATPAPPPKPAAPAPAAAPTTAPAAAAATAVPAKPTTAPAAAPTTAPAAAATTAPAAAAKPAGGARTTVRFATWVGVFKDIPPAFSAKHPIDVTFETIPYGEIGDKLLIDLASGTAADVVEIPQPYMKPFERRKGLLAITDLIKRDKVDTAAFAMPLDKVSNFEGKQWMYPLIMPLARAMGYNITLLEKYGIPTPKPEWTWDDLTTHAMKAHKPPDSYAMQAPRDQFTLNEMIWSNGGELLNADETKATLDMPQTVEALQAAADWLLKHKVTMQPGEQKALGDQPFASGKIAFLVPVIFGSWDSWLAYTNKNQMPAWLTSFPVSPKTKKRVVELQTHARGISGKTKVTDQAWQFLNWSMTDDEGVTLQWKNVAGPYKIDKFIAELPDPKQKEFMLLAKQPIADGRAESWGPRPSEYLKIFFAQWDNVLLGKVSVPDAMKEATKQINDALAN